MYPGTQSQPQQQNPVSKWKSCSYAFAKQQGYYIYSLPGWVITKMMMENNVDLRKYRLGKRNDAAHINWLNQGVPERIIEGAMSPVKIKYCKVPSKDPKRRGMFDFVFAVDEPR